MQRSFPKKSWPKAGRSADLAGRLALETAVVDGVTHTASTSFAAFGVVASRTYSDGTTQSGFTYDAAQRLIAVSGIVTDARFNDRGRVTSLSYANGVTTSLAHRNTVLRPFAW